MNELRCWNFVVGTSLFELRCGNCVVGTVLLKKTSKTFATKLPSLKTLAQPWAFAEGIRTKYIIPSLNFS